MRRRLLLSTLTAVLLAVFLLGVPLAIAGDLLLVDQSRHDVQTRARSMALAVDHLVPGWWFIVAGAIAGSIAGGLIDERP